MRILFLLFFHMDKYEFVKNVVTPTQIGELLLLLCEPNDDALSKYSTPTQ